METFAVTISILSGVITISSVIGLLWKLFGWFDKLRDGEKANKDDIKRLKEEVKSTKEEAMLLVEGLSACLDGLKQLGANHCVCEAKEMLDEYINKRAHK